MERLAAADLTNAEWQRDLVAWYNKLATHYTETKDTAAIEYRLVCDNVLRRMNTKGMFLARPLVQFLEQLDHKL